MDKTKIQIKKGERERGRKYKEQERACFLKRWNEGIFVEISQQMAKLQGDGLKQKVQSQEWIKERRGRAWELGRSSAVFDSFFLPFLWGRAEEKKTQSDGNKDKDKEIEKDKTRPDARQNSQE